MKRGLFVAALFLAAPLLWAQPVATKIDTRASEISYSGTSMLHDWTGTSRSVAGSLSLDMANPGQSRIEIVVPVESFDSGNSNRDSNMLDATEVERYPNVRFVSTSVSQTGTGAWLVKGNLTFHGQTRPIEVPVHVSRQGNVFQATGGFSLLLTDYKVRRPKLMLRPIGDEIRFAFTIKAPLTS